MPCVSTWLKDIKTLGELNSRRRWKSFRAGFSWWKHSLWDFYEPMGLQNMLYYYFLRKIYSAASLDNSLETFLEKYFNVKEDFVPHMFVLSFEKVIPWPSLKEFVKWHISLSTPQLALCICKWTSHYWKGKIYFLLINVMYCGVAWQLLVSYVTPFNSYSQIVNALIRHNTGDLQKHLAWKQVPIIVWK